MTLSKESGFLSDSMKFKVADVKNFEFSSQEALVTLVHAYPLLVLFYVPFHTSCIKLSFLLFFTQLTRFKI